MTLRIGAVFPTSEIGNDPVAIRDWAQTAEELGYRHLIVYDHVLGAEHAGRDPKLVGPYTEKDPFHEPLVLLGYLAGVTKRIELTTGILILPQRQTVLVAKQAAELDLLSGGRLRLGVGTGWNWVEYDALGVPFAGRGKRFDEQVELLRKLWSEALLDYTGQYHRVERAGLVPLPEHRIPLWFGAMSDVAVKRAARTGEGVLYGTKPSRLRRIHQVFLAEAEKAGRDPSTLGAEAVLDFADGPDDWRREIELWRELGGTHLSIRAMDTGAEMMGIERMGYSGLGDYIAALETFHKETH
jgi:probable F420-dependent oxidoreductase